MSSKAIHPPSVQTDGETLAHEAYFNELREREYPMLNESHQIYLDYTGGNLYAQSQLRAHFELLSNNVFGNPHSTNPTSQFATQKVEETREAVLKFFNADDYCCIFTQNASGALHIVGECYPFHKNGTLLLLSDNHNSVNGIREYCQRKDREFAYTPLQYEDLNIDSVSLEKHLANHPNKENKLFAYPAQSNVTGVKHQLNWIQKAHELGWDVLLDAAAFVPTNVLDLSRWKPDFVTLSFYKIFGYPTGIGALLVRKEKFHKLEKQWFAGGTVTLAAVNSPHHYLAENHERFENGTVNYLDIPAIKTGLDYIQGIGMGRINERVKSLVKYFHTRLTALKHDTGRPVVRVFGPPNRQETGGTFIMNFFDANGKVLPFEDIEEKANQRGISIRSGCFCNPGIDEINNCLSTEEIARYFTSRDRGNYRDMIAFLNKMRGATRVSVGLATNKEDLDTFLAFAAELRNLEAGVS
ncbi:MAG: aminotransferase class V-fold PLP-dependent enzyme [Bacteroidia bacterium]|nr:aminotransferase class V-fold PLP-dependent enzyme [Bacteroidia bacterium]